MKRLFLNTSDFRAYPLTPLCPLYHHQRFYVASLFQSILTASNVLAHTLVVNNFLRHKVGIGWGKCLLNTQIGSKAVVVNKNKND